MKMLFIAYYFEPYPYVGAKRISYWANNLQCEKPDWLCDVITVPKSGKYKKPASINKIIYISPEKCLLSNLIKDKGWGWLKPLERYLNVPKNFDYDCVVITGGPFLHFRIIEFLKKKYKVPIILDFRDPFSQATSGFIYKKVKSIIEKRVCKFADKVIVPNRYCYNLALCDEKKYICIDNGYDDSFLNNINRGGARNKNDNKIHLFYTGKFIKGRSPECLLSVVSSGSYRNRIIFHYYGQDSDKLLHYLRHENIKTYGYVNYNDMLAEISYLDIAVLFATGREYESTTKVFDYIALKKPIIVISDAQIDSGAIFDILKKYPMVWFLKNTADDIKSTLDYLLSYSDFEFDFNSDQFSRRHGLLKLIKVVAALLK